MNALNRACVWLAPEETASERVLPLTLLVRPVPLLGLVVLGVNDHVLKGSGLVPGWLTGKLSDVAGMVYFPLLLVTGLNLFGWVITRVGGRPVRWASPTMTQVTVACIATALFFSAVQLSVEVKDFYARVTAMLSFWSNAPYVQVTMDPTDVFTAPAVLVAWWQGRRSVARVPPGRLGFVSGSEAIERSSWASDTGLGDVVRLLKTEDARLQLREVLRAVANGDSERADAALRVVRGQ